MKTPLVPHREAGVFPFKRPIGECIVRRKIAVYFKIVRPHKCTMWTKLQCLMLNLTVHVLPGFIGFMTIQGVSEKSGHILDTCSVDRNREKSSYRHVFTV
jgi:hypothetical protein